ncbi:hypothetical protein [uncultured Ruegeria sp.]|uniref:hypothetical protein n=1 Tax=uncultured Ruegeria sp. TaxID=259304 RepID=UPI00261A9A63|nr:hypothetical protein [uncultured Ruegeria sp.]
MKVVFAYRIGQKAMGGKAMRVDQLAAMAQAHLSERYAFEVALAPKSSRPHACRRFVDVHIAASYEAERNLCGY